MGTFHEIQSMCPQLSLFFCFVMVVGDYCPLGRVSIVRRAGLSLLISLF